MNHENSILEDELNPEYLFTGTKNQLLQKIVKGEIDPVLLAKQSLADRGLNEDGQWIGFEQAEEHFKLTPRN